MYAVGIQNEPSFGQSYGSCVYDPVSMAAVIGVTGKRFEDNKISTKIIFPEDMGEVSINNQFVITLNNNALAKKYGHIFGVHQYNQDGVTPGSIASSTWSSLYKIAQRGATRPIWMTETSGFGAGVPAMEKMYTTIYSALKFGNISAWNWYDATDNDSDVEHASAFFVKKDGKQIFTKKGQAFRHYSKHIRPGAIMVEANCAADADILPLAFQDNFRNRLTIILINNDSVNSKTILLNFTDANSPKKFGGYRTSDKIDYQVMDSISASSSITLPPNCITTLVGNNSKPIISATENVESINRKYQLTVYPNPSKDGFYIRGNAAYSDIIEIKLLDLQGKELKTILYANDGNDSYINTENLRNGVYMLKYNNRFEKIVINK